MSNPRRRLKAILFADIVKFSALMVEDESECIRIRNAIAKLAHQCAAEHDGAVRNEAGDGFMLVFESAVDAIGAALSMQSGMSELDLVRPDGSQAQLRIGIHSGDIVEEDDSILGDAINVAARVETVATPGGICVTAEIEAQVRPVLNLAFRPVKRKPTKAFPRDIKVFDVSSDDLALRKLRARISRRLAIFAAVGTVLTGLILLQLFNHRGARLPTPPFRAEFHQADDADIVLHAEPDRGSEVLGKFKGGGEVKVEEYRKLKGGERWVRISIRPGWMASVDLREEDDGEMITIGEFEDGEQTATGTVVYDGKDGLNLRSTPDIRSKEYLALREGTRLIVSEKEIKTEIHHWRQVEFYPAWVQVVGADGNEVVTINQL